jgi:ABC-type uncharacterized transport system involved in gliding motility auxiliary subunit
MRRWAARVLPPPPVRAVILGVVVVALLVAVNALAAQATQRVDLTRTGLYTLSPRSVAVTRQLGADLVVTGFFGPAEEPARRDVADLLEQYREQSAHVRVRFVDPAHYPTLARGLGVTVSDSVALQYRSRPAVVLGVAQQDEVGITGAIVRLESSRSPTVCWATGDGERDLRDADQVGGYSAVGDLLRTSDYRVQTTSLDASGIPSTCDVLVVAQLSRPLGSVEIRAIQDYLARNGSLLLAVDPWLDPGVVASANALVRPYGAVFEGGLVIEPDTAHAATDDPTVPVVSDFAESPITQNLAGRYVFFPQATAVTGTSPAGMSSVSLASTTGSAYTIPTQRTSLSRRSADPAGPFSLMWSIEASRPSGTARIVLSGTSSLAENRTMPSAATGANSDLLLASLDWLSRQDPLASLEPRPPDAAPLSLSGLDLRVNEVLAVGVPPLFVLAIGAVVAVRRRRSTERTRSVRY